MIRLTSFLLCALCMSLSCSAQLKDHGFYSRPAAPIWERITISHRPLEIPSPDGRSNVTATQFENSGDGPIDLGTSGKIGVIHFSIGPGVDSELLWAPDSSAFFVTTSDGGANGLYRTIVVDTFEGTLQDRDVTQMVYNAFGHPFKCGSEEPPNVGGIAWAGQTHNVWVAAEVIAHSNCDSFGTFRAYEIDLSEMKIVRVLDQLEAKRRLRPMLGRELRFAPDECIRKPTACYVTSNHPELFLGQKVN